MPRKPTGRPRGRPVGTGKLGEEIVRLTVRLPADLYARLDAFAAGRAYRRGEAHLSDCARDALEHFLVCPHKRQPEKRTASAAPDSETPGQQPGEPPLVDDTARDTADDLEAIPLTLESAHTQPASAPLSPCGHPAARWNAKRRVCRDCDAEGARQRRARQRQAQQQHIETSILNLR